MERIAKAQNIEADDVGEIQRGNKNSEAKMFHLALVKIRKSS